MKRSLITFLAPFVVASSLNAAVDMFLRLEGIKGESKDDVYRDTIEVDSFSWGGNNTGASSGGGSGKVTMQDFHFVAKMSKASPQLLLHTAAGKHIPEAILYGRKSGASGAQQEYFKVILTDVLVTSYQTGGANASESDDRPTEEVAFYYNKITFVHISDDGTETIGEAVRTPVAPQ